MSKQKNELQEELLKFDPAENYGFPAQRSSKWKNRQRTLIVGSRGIKADGRHLIKNLSSLMAHSKRETKIEKNGGIREQVGSSCEMKDCENFLYFEQRRDRLYLYLGKFETGPTFKFQVTGIKTANELKLIGNCLKHSRPLISFDESFSKSPEMKVFKSLAQDAFNTPKYHPKSQPFHDKIFHFGLFQGQIYFRNYQVIYSTVY